LSVDVVFTEEVEQRFTTYQIHSHSLFKGSLQVVDSVRRPVSVEKLAKRSSWLTGDSFSKERKWVLNL
jgi:hypothetical protein